MSADLVSILLQFQPEAPELKQRRDYDQAARSFVTQLSNNSASHWWKGSDTPQELLTVSGSQNELYGLPADHVDPQPRGQFNSLRLCAPSRHCYCR